MKFGSTIMAALTIILAACRPSDTTSPAHDFSQAYSIYENKLYRLHDSIQLIGANSLHVFAAGSRDMNNWNLDIAREFIGNMKETLLSGSVVQDAQGAFLYPLQRIVDSNRLHHRITIICPFGWDGSNSTLFTGTTPSKTSWWVDYRTKMQEWASHFANQPDVWIEVWNEPFRFDRADGYTDEVWVSEMTSMVALIRAVGNNNIVLVPCAEQGQDESVLLSKGKSFLSANPNTLFDIHAYEKWLLVTPAQLSLRLSQVQTARLPVFFGEVGPVNAGTLMNPAPFLDSVYSHGLSVCAWVWKYDGTDQDALLDVSGNPNNNNNNNWGTIYKQLALRYRKP